MHAADRPGPGGLERLAAELPPGLRALGAGRLLTALATEQHLAVDVVSVGLLGHGVALVYRSAGRLTLAHHDQSQRSVVHRGMLGVLADELLLMGAWDTPSRCLTVELADGSIERFTHISPPHVTDWIASLPRHQ